MLDLLKLEHMLLQSLLKLMHKLKLCLMNILSPCKEVVLLITQLLILFQDAQPHHTLQNHLHHMNVELDSQVNGDNAEMPKETTRIRLLKVILMMLIHVLIFAV